MFLKIKTSWKLWILHVLLTPVNIYHVLENQNQQ
jgi:hypothetical protein